MTRLHLIREKAPDPKPYYVIQRVACDECNEWVYLVHLDLPPEDPK